MLCGGHKTNKKDEETKMTKETKTRRCLACGAVNGIKASTITCPWCGGRTGPRDTESKSRRVSGDELHVGSLGGMMVGATRPSSYLPEPYIPDEAERERRRRAYEVAVSSIVDDQPTIVRCGKCGNFIKTHEILSHKCEPEHPQCVTCGKDVPYGEERVHVCKKK